ncbi:MAG: hypothetical protein ACK4U0_02695 [Mesorhizobium sp.]
MTSADIIWSKGVGDFCDVAGTRAYRRDWTESTRPGAFFARYYSEAYGLVWVRLGTVARDGRTCDLDTFVRVALPTIKKPFILITTDGDLSVPSELRQQTVAALKASPMMVAWYSQNVDGSDPDVKPYPIGLDIHSLQDWITAPRMLATLKRLGRAAAPAQARPMRVFSDLALTPTDARREAHAALEGCAHVDVATKRVSQIEIWRRYASYPFVMSAHGNGLDCHRTWEVLCLGCIPIVKTSSLDPLYTGLPVAIVEDWRQVRDIALLERWLGEFAPLTDPASIQSRLHPQAWLGPLRDSLAISG